MDGVERRQEGRIRSFLADEDGSQTVEAVIWLPILFTILALVINVSLVFFDQSQILRVVQDGNRAISKGTFSTTAEVTDYVSQNLDYLSATISVNSSISGGFVTTTVVVPALDLMPITIPGNFFSDTTISVVAKHLMES